MKRNLLILAMVIVFAVTAHSESAFFTGIRIDDGLYKATVGTAIPITDKIMSMSYGDVGVGGTLGTELAYIFKPYSKFGIGPIAGPSVSSTTEDLVTYLTGAVGVITVYGGSSIGLWGAAKYKVEFEPSNFPKGWLFGAGFYIGL